MAVIQLKRKPINQLDCQHFDTNKLIREALAEAGFPPPTPAQIVHVMDRR